jgi:hypothetical protein
MGGNRRHHRSGTTSPSSGLRPSAPLPSWQRAEILQTASIAMPRNCSSALVGVCCWRNPTFDDINRAKQSSCSPSGHLSAAIHAAPATNGFPCPTSTKSVI